MRGARVDVGVEARRDRTHEWPSAVGDPERLPIAFDQSILIRLEQIGQEPLMREVPIGIYCGPS